MGNYATDQNLVAIRPDVLQLTREGTWADKITQAEEHINRLVERRWYRASAEERGLDPRATLFDPANIPDSSVPSADKRDTQLTLLTCYKALELVYGYVAAETREPGAHERFRDHFAKKFKDEWEEILAVGIDYDWDKDAQLEAAERAVPQHRRLVRM